MFLLTPTREHTPVVSDVNVTGSPDDAVAKTVNPESRSVRSAIGPKVIVWAVVPAAEPTDQLASGAMMPLTASVIAQNTVRRLRGFPVSTRLKVLAHGRANAASR